MSILWRPRLHITRKDIPIGFIEAKDIGNPDLDGLRKTGNKKQFDRYKLSLGNLMATSASTSITTEKSKSPSPRSATGK
jgi:hypothetical protein